MKNFSKEHISMLNVIAEDIHNLLTVVELDDALFIMAVLFQDMIEQYQDPEDQFNTAAQFMQFVFRDSKKLRVRFEGDDDVGALN